VAGRGSKPALKRFISVFGRGGWGGRLQVRQVSGVQESNARTGHSEVLEQGCSTPRRPVCVRPLLGRCAGHFSDGRDRPCRLARLPAVMSLWGVVCGVGVSLNRDRLRMFRASCRSVNNAEPKSTHVARMSDKWRRRRTMMRASELAAQDILGYLEFKSRGRY